MSRITLEPLAQLATHLVGEPVIVRFRDLKPFKADGRAGKIGPRGEWVIELDYSLGEWRHEHFSHTFAHELGHVWYRHQVPGDAVEREADAFADRLAAEVGPQMAWRFAHESLNFDACQHEWPRFVALAAQLRAERAPKAVATVKHAPPASTRHRAPVRGQAYTREALEAEYRSGALVRARQMEPGTVESMIANSLGLPSGELSRGGERRIERRITYGGRTVAAAPAGW